MLKPSSLFALLTLVALLGACSSASTTTPAGTSTTTTTVASCTDVCAVVVRLNCGIDATSCPGACGTLSNAARNCTVSATTCAAADACTTLKDPVSTQPDAGTTSGARTCKDIESDYLKIATASDARTCTDVQADCSIEFGLCSKSGGLTRGNTRGVYKKSVVDALKVFLKEYTDLGCRSTGDNACPNQPAGGSMSCAKNVCTAT